MKKLRSFKVAKAKAMKKPVCLLKVLAGGDVELRFNRRHKKGKLNFEFIPWYAPKGCSDTKKGIQRVKREGGIFREAFKSKKLI